MDESTGRATVGPDGPRRSGSWKVHLVEPDPVERQRLRIFLEARGVDVTASETLRLDGPELGDGSYDAVVSELVDGPERLVARIGRRAPGVPVIVWTSTGEPEVLSRLGELGCVVAPKPAPGTVAFQLGRIAASRSDPRPRSGPGVGRRSRPRRPGPSDSHTLGAFGD